MASLGTQHLQYLQGSSHSFGRIRKNNRNFLLVTHLATWFSRLSGPFDARRGALTWGVTADSSYSWPDVGKSVKCGGHWRHSIFFTQTASPHKILCRISSGRPSVPIGPCGCITGTDESLYLIVVQLAHPQELLFLGLVREMLHLVCRRPRG